MIKEEYCPGDMTRYRMFMDKPATGNIIAGCVMEGIGQSFVLELGYGVINEGYVASKLPETVNPNTVTAFCAWLKEKGLNAEYKATRPNYPAPNAVTGQW